MINSKSSLAVLLSKLKKYENPKFIDEQYETESEIAAQVLWDAFMKGNIQDKTIADLGAGTGILGIGAALLGAKKVFMIEKDKDAFVVCKENIDELSESFPELKKIITLKNLDIAVFNETIEVVIQNPPFGTKIKHADKQFLEKAFSISNKIYSFHKTSTKQFVESISKDNNFSIKEEHRFSFPLKSTMSFHKKRIERIEVTCFVLEKKI